MSDRTWLGKGKQPWADYNLSDYPSMEDLCKDAAWKLPAKVWAGDLGVSQDFFQVMSREHSMQPKEFSTFGLLGTNGERRELTEEEAYKVTVNIDS